MLYALSDDSVHTYDEVLINEYSNETALELF